MPRTNDIKRPEYTAALRIAPRGMLDEPKDPVRGVSFALKRVLETAQPRYAASARPLNIPAASPPLPPLSSRRSASSVHARASASTEEEYSECSGVTSGIPCARKAGVNRLNSGRGRDDERSPPPPRERRVVAVTAAAAINRLIYRGIYGESARVPRAEIYLAGGDYLRRSIREGCQPSAVVKTRAGNSNTFYYSARDRGDPPRFSRFESTRLRADNGSSFPEAGSLQGFRVSVIRNGSLSGAVTATGSQQGARGSIPQHARVIWTERTSGERNGEKRPSLRSGGFSVYLDEATAAHNCRPAAPRGAR